jgi:hypothetical protein
MVLLVRDRAPVVVAVPVETQLVEQVVALVVSIQYSYAVAPVLDAQVRAVLIATPVAASAGLVLAKAPGAATMVVKDL